MGVLIVLISPLFPLSVSASSGLGVSGSFSGTIYKMVAGETMDSQNVSVIFFNTTDADVAVRLTGEGPQGILFTFQNQEATIKAHGSLIVAVAFTLSTTTAEGSYTLSVKAEIVSTQGTGLTFSGFAALKATLIVMGEAGDVSISLHDYRQNPFIALLTLMRINADGSSDPVAESKDGNLDERLIPATYQVKAFYQDHCVAQKTFELNDKDDLKISLLAQTIRIPLFLSDPQFDQKEQLTSLSLAYTLQNLYVKESGVKLILSVTKDEKALEDTEMLKLDELDVGEVSGKLNYIPVSGWKNGNYTLRLSLISQEGLILATSDPQTLNVSQPVSFKPEWFLVGVIPLLILFLRRKKKASP